MEDGRRRRRRSDDDDGPVDRGGNDQKKWRAKEFNVLIKINYKIVDSWLVTS